MTQHQVLNSKYKNGLIATQGGWDSFCDENLQNHQWKNYKPDGFSPKVGEVVLLRPEKISNRAFVPLRKITELIVGVDGELRLYYRTAR